MPGQEPPVQELIRTLNSLAGELEVLVDRTRSNNIIDENLERNIESNHHTEKDFSKHKALNTPVRWEFILQHSETIKYLTRRYNVTASFHTPSTNIINSGSMLVTKFILLPGKCYLSIPTPRQHLNLKLKPNTFMDLLLTKTICLSEIESIRNSWEG